MENKVKLISSDGQEFIIDYNIAIQSQTLKAFFGNPSLFKESTNREIVIPTRSVYLKRVVEFLIYKHKAKSTVSEFQIEDSEALELLDIAAYLRI